MRIRHAFTLVELLVVIGVIALLTSLLLPAVASARRAANTAKCLANIRNMEVAHWLYINGNRGMLIQVGLPHGTAHDRPEVAWINTLQEYYQYRLLARCPADISPHWPDGLPAPDSNGRYRTTSYGVNNFLDWQLCPEGGPYIKINQIRNPSRTVQFLEMTYTGPFAGADHPHVEIWVSNNPPVQASKHLQIDAHGGPPRSWNSVANYGFLDGHAETLRFSDVFRDWEQNQFNPAVTK